MKTATHQKTQEKKRKTQRKAKVKYKAKEDKKNEEERGKGSPWPVLEWAWEAWRPLGGHGRKKRQMKKKR